jgi:hypothetical protein
MVAQNDIFVRDKTRKKDAVWLVKDRSLFNVVKIEIRRYERAQAEINQK